MPSIELSQIDLSLSAHVNAPLTVEGRHRFIERCRTRPIAHVAAEMGVSRATASKRVNRYRHEDEDGLADRSSRPGRCPVQTPTEVVTRIENLQRERKRSVRRIWIELTDAGVEICQATVGRRLTRLGLNRCRWLDVDGTPLRKPDKIIARYRGHMIRLDTKKVGRVPDGGGWRAHERGMASPMQKVGYTCLHSAIDGFSRLAAEGIRHQRIRPYTPCRNGKVERYNRILAEELSCARPYASRAQLT